MTEKNREAYYDVNVKRELFQFEDDMDEGKGRINMCYSRVDNFDRRNEKLFDYDGDFTKK